MMAGGRTWECFVMWLGDGDGDGDSDGDSDSYSDDGMVILMVMVH